MKLSIDATRLRPPRQRLSSNMVSAHAKLPGKSGVFTAVDRSGKSLFRTLHRSTALEVRGRWSPVNPVQGMQVIGSASDQ